MAPVVGLASSGAIAPSMGTMGPVGKASPTSPTGVAGPLLSLIYPPRRVVQTRALQASLSSDSKAARRSSAEWAVSMSRFAGINNYAVKPQRQTVATCNSTGANSNGNVVNAAEIERPAEGLAKTALLGALFAGWYIFNIYFNIYNKQVLKVFPFPITCTNLQFFVGSAVVLAMWGLKLHRVPKLNKETVLTILPLAVVHTLGNLLTNVSLGQVAVSFTHTIKAMEPFFSVALSAMFLGDIPSVKVLLTLIPIVGGVACASLSEPTFNWAGFAAAMGSNLTFQSRNVLSKKLMKDVGNIDNINLFSIITLMSSVLLLPITLLTEGFQFSASNMSSMGILDPSAIIGKALIAGLCFHLYQQVSYMILSRVSPVTHSIGNCVKRVVVIIASVIVFANPVTQQNAIGTTIALLGVFAYSQVKRLPTKKSNTK